MAISKGNNIAILLVFLLICSCGAGKHLPSETNITKKDSTAIRYKDSLIVRDSVVYIELPSEGSTNILPTFTPSHLETSVAESDAFVDSLGLHHTLTNKEKPLQSHVPITEHIIISDSNSTHQNSETHTEYVQVEKPLSWWKKFRMNGFWWMLGVNIILLLWVTRKLWLKLIML